MINIKIGKVSLFECKRERGDIHVDHKKTLKLENKEDQYDSLITCLIANIQQKIGGKGTYFLSKRTGMNTESALEIYNNNEKAGPKPVSYERPLLDAEKIKAYKKIIQSKTEEEFQKNSALIGNLLSNKLETSKGILVFVDFFFESGGEIHKFLAILITDYENDIFRYNDSEILEYLEKTIKQDFHVTILYPHITLINENGPTAKDDTFDLDYNKVRIHTKQEKANSVCEAIGAELPINPLKEVENIVRESESLQDIKEKDTLGLTKLTYINLDFDDCLSLKIPFEYWETQKVKTFKTSKGAVILVKDCDPEVWLGGINLLDSKKHKFGTEEDLKNIFKENDT